MHAARVFLRQTDDPDRLANESDPPGAAVRALGGGEPRRLALGLGLEALSRWSAKPVGLIITAQLLHVILFAARASMVDILRTSAILLGLTGLLFVIRRVLILSRHPGPRPNRPQRVPG